MRVNEKVYCETFPCVDVRSEAYIIPDININPENVCMIMISEATPADQKDDYYAGNNSLFEQTTVLAFNDTGLLVRSIKDILKFGVYLTSAVKCGKIGYGIKAATIKECSLILELSANEVRALISGLNLGVMDLTNDDRVTVREVLQRLGALQKEAADDDDTAVGGIRRGVGIRFGGNGAVPKDDCTGSSDEFGHR